MNNLASYTIALIGVALSYLWLLSIALSVRLQMARQRSIAKALSSAIVFGPLAALAFIFLYRNSRKARAPALKIFSFPAVLVGLACVVCGALLGFLTGKYFFHLVGESIQLPVGAGILTGALLGGMLMAYTAQRLAVMESLFVLCLSIWLPIFLGDKILLLFTYGTATAYFATLLAATAALSLLMLVLGGSLGFLFAGEGKFTWQFSFEKFVGLRFLMTKRSSHAVSLITIISVFAVVIGCAGMVVVMSVMDGFSSDLRRKILGTNAHLVVMKYGDSFRDYESIIKRTKDLPQVLGASPYILNEVMISSESNISGAVIKGIDVKSVDAVSILGANVNEGSLAALDDPEMIPHKKSNSAKSELDAIEDLFSKPASAADKSPVLPGIVIGIEMAKFLRLSIGSTLTVVSPISEMGPAGPIPKAKNFRVAAIFFSGMYEYDAKFVYISLAEANIFFGMKGSVNGIEYKIADLERTEAFSAQIKNLLGGYPYYTRDWMQMNRNLFSALKLEKIAMFIILIALIFMASLLILVALVMVVMEKGKEIAILKSIGVTDLSIMKIFVTYGLSIGSIGAFLGVGLGLLMAGLISVFGIGLDPEVYYISELPVKIDALDVALVAVAAVIISFLATIPPSLFAARLKPVEGLRYD